jgi:hypothetical protein
MPTEVLGKGHDAGTAAPTESNTSNVVGVLLCQCADNV